MPPAPTKPSAGASAAVAAKVMPFRSPAGPGSEAAMRAVSTGWDRAACGCVPCVSCCSHREMREACWRWVLPAMMAACCWIGEPASLRHCQCPPLVRHGGPHPMAGICLRCSARLCPCQVGRTHGAGVQCDRMQRNGATRRLCCCRQVRGERAPRRRVVCFVCWPGGRWVARVGQPAAARHMAVPPALACRLATWLAGWLDGRPPRQLHARQACAA